MTEAPEQIQEARSRRFRPYPKYQDSGVEWLGEIPEHWEVMKTTWLFSIGSGTTPRTEDPVYYGGNIPWVTTSELRESVIFSTEKSVTKEALRDISSLKLHPKGSVIVAMYGATIGRLGVLGVDATVNQACCVFSKPRNIHLRFWFHWLLMRRSHLISLAYGGGQPNLSQELLRSIRLPSPPKAEQCAISVFLDQETEKIDALVAKKEWLIELLQEKRTALITQAVTKGLDPSVPMKDSGVEWLGKIPAHWHLRKLKYVCERVFVGIAEAATFAYVDDGVPMLRSTNVRPNRIRTGDIRRIDRSFAVRLTSKQLRNGDIVTVRTGNAGVSAVVPPVYDGGQCFTLVVSRPSGGHDSRYFCYWLNAPMGQQQFAVEGMGTAQINISVPIVQNTIVCVPPPKEQNLIADWIGQEVERWDALIMKIGDAIDRLKEYRTALISAAVTGKIDVREKVA